MNGNREVGERERGNETGRQKRGRELHGLGEEKVDDTKIVCVPGISSVESTHSRRFDIASQQFGTVGTLPLFPKLQPLLLLRRGRRCIPGWAHGRRLGKRGRGRQAIGGGGGT